MCAAADIEKEERKQRHRLSLAIGYGKGEWAAEGETTQQLTKKGRDRKISNGIVVVIVIKDPLFFWGSLGRIPPKKKSEFKMHDKSCPRPLYPPLLNLIHLSRLCQVKTLLLNIICPPLNTAEQKPPSPPPPQRLQFFKVQLRGSGSRRNIFHCLAVPDSQIGHVFISQK